MKIESHIDFARELLNKMHISSVIINDPDNFISSLVDKNLRFMIFGEENYAKLLVNSPNEAKDNTVYRFCDEYKCTYIFLKMPHSVSEYLFVGPYLLSLPNEEFIELKSLELRLNEYQKSEFYTYYRSLPIIENESIILSIIDTLGVFIYGSAENFNTEYIDYEIFDFNKPVFASEFVNSEYSSSLLSLEIIEQNYKNENFLMDAVSKGKLNKVDLITSHILNQGTEMRTSDTLRNRKNYLVILNTILRKSAEYGKVHPFHIDKLSSFFAKSIENLFSVESSLDLQKDMIRKYCLLVKEHSLKNYSPLIGKVITLISYDISANLTLNYIASLMNVNPSYLSATFKKETGQTLTDYVNASRMELAVHILTTSDKQIQAIAEECGILDANYFIKLFKKQYGITPSQYKKQIKINKAWYKIKPYFCRAWCRGACLWCGI